jgi:hypothetical protein
MPAKSIEIQNINEGFGIGEHKLYYSDTWDGKEFTISRFAKRNGIYTLSKTSASEYEVWIDRENTRFLAFHFGKRHAGHPFYFHQATFMVDVWEDGNDIAILVTDGRDYSYIRSSRKLPPLEQGKHYFMTPADDRLEWKFILVMRGLEFGDPENSVVNGAYQSVKFVSINEIELSYKNRSDGVKIQPKKLKLTNGIIEVNGKSIPQRSTTTRLIFDESDFEKRLAKLTPEMQMKALLFQFESKERVIEFFKKFHDRALADRFTKSFEEAFNNPDFDKSE